MLLALDRLDEAEELFLRTLRTAEALDDRDSGSRALEGLGLIASRRGRFERAIELLEEALERAGGEADPEERFELFRELARLYGEGTNLPRSIEILEECLARMRDRAETDAAKMVGYTVFLSYAYSDLGDYGHATAVLTDALREDAEEIDKPTRSTAYRALSRLYAVTGQTPLAVEYARRGVAVANETGNEWDQGMSHLLLAHVLLDDGQADAAGRELVAARRAYGDRMSGMDEGFVRVEEARRALQQGDPEGAADLAREAIELLGNLSVPGQLGESYLVLARSYDETGRPDRAEQAYAAAIDALKRQNGWHCELGRAYRWYGKFLRKAGRTEAAMEAFEQAADLAPSNHDRPDTV
ncbi:MAG TPA: tetratricopeptide repeat protein [Gaiellales bacterium]|nr:tetratricopeptide repeat protein [Gaiellales bacterium]